MGRVTLGNELKHVLIIPDGNRRYARENNKNLGEVYGVSSMRVTKLIIEFFLVAKKINEVSFFAISRDNLLKRKSLELDPIFEAHYNTYRGWLASNFFLENDISINFYGDKELLPLEYVEFINKLEQRILHKDASRHCNILVAYDGLWEINRACEFLKLNPNSQLTDFLMIKNQIDLLIRTGGVFRISNSPICQLAYAELFFEDFYYPEMTEEKLEGIYSRYVKINRRYGQ